MSKVFGLFNIYKTTLLIMVVLSCNCLSSYGEDKIDNWKPTIIFLLGGQSNMEGQGKVSELPKEFLTPLKNVKMWTKSGWVDLISGEKFGPEIGFAYEIAKKWPKQRIGIVKHAVGGTNLQQWGAPDYTKAGFIFKTWMDTLEAAQKSAPNAPVAGVLWMQGESDAKDQALAESYKVNFKNLIEAVRKEVKNKNLPFIFGKIQSKNVKFLSTVWKAQEETVREIKNAILINTDDIQLNSDVLHFGTKGQLELGHRFALEAIKSTSGSKREASEKKENE